MDCCLDMWMTYTAYMIFVGLGLAAASLIWWVVATLIDANIRNRLPQYYKNIFHENDILKDENRKYKEKFGDLPKDS